MRYASAILFLLLSFTGGACNQNSISKDLEPKSSPNLEPKSSPSPIANPSDKSDTTSIGLSPNNPPGTQPQNIPPFIDLLTVAAGTTIVSGFVGEISTAGRALRLIDGNNSPTGISNDQDPPAVFIYELPAPTTFDKFSIPGLVEHPGNATIIRNMKIEGSNQGPDQAYTTLVDTQLRTVETREDEVLLQPLIKTSVRWIKVVLSEGILIEHPPGKTTLQLTELKGYGSQEPMSLSQAFTGKWDFRFLDAPNKSGHTLELQQDGSTVQGCFNDTRLTGTVTGPIARLQGYDAKRDVSSVYLFTVTAAGELQGLESTRNGVFRPRIGPVASPDASTICSEDPKPSPPSCNSIVYINFDLNKALIRPDSEPVLQDLFRGIQGTQGTVIIEGHTSTEGSEEDNLELSKRRAQAVVDKLQALGINQSRLEASGKGELMPLVPENDETSRALNRRVEIKCR